MDGPAVAVNAHPNSASAVRLCQGRTPCGNVSRTTSEVLTSWCTTDTSISRWRPIARNDGERLATQRSYPLKHQHQAGVGPNQLTVALVGKLSSAEVFT